ncbi:MAG: signal peptidase I [Bacteroidota bacterium]
MATNTRSSRSKRARKRDRAAKEGAAQDGHAKKQEGWRETVRFYVIAIAVILFIRTFFFTPFRIPTPSMEDSLLVGDFLIVSKIGYGARTPNTIGVPFTNIYLPGIEFPQARLPGLGGVERGDIVVFNYPPSSTDDPRFGTPAGTPIERRHPYVKRVLGLPGDTIAVVDKLVYVNGEAYPLEDGQQHNWLVELAPGGRVGAATLDDLGLEPVEAFMMEQLYGQARTDSTFGVNGSSEEAAELVALPAVEAVTPLVIPDDRGESIFPRSRTQRGQAGVNRDNVPPLPIPKAGATVPLNRETWPYYRAIVNRYEGHTARLLADGTVEVDGTVQPTYTFEQDYYVGIGDNRDNSEDSRFWGFVPHDHVIGEVKLVFLSFDTERFFLPRVTRTFRPVR